MKTCLDCLGKEEDGAKFSPNRKVCNQCRWTRRKIRVELEGRMGGKSPEKIGVRFPRVTDFHILWSPKSEYPRGHYFGNGEFVETLKAGLFTMGMIVRSRDKKYVVCGSGSADLWLKKLGYPLNAVFPEQWLVQVDGQARR